MMQAMNERWSYTRTPEFSGARRLMITLVFVTIMALLLAGAGYFAGSWGGGDAKRHYQDPILIPTPSS